MRRCMYITSPQLSDKRAYVVLNDTGAQFSAISMQLVKKHRLYTRPVQRGEPVYISMADRTKVVKRIGTVSISVTVHFSGGGFRKPYACTKSFEVLDMNYDFILGVDINFSRLIIS